jgi:putative membrane protein
MYWNDHLIISIVLFVMVLILVLVIGGVIFFIRILVPRRKKTDRASESVLDILRVRYAKGEITRDQFEQMKKELL